MQSLGEVIIGRDSEVKGVGRESSPQSVLLRDKEGWRGKWEGPSGDGVQEGSALVQP